MPGPDHSTHDLCDRFRCSSRTLFRRMKRPRNPFPLPCIRHAGSCNLWDATEVAAWEARERDHARGEAGSVPSGGASM
jgi:hypothetical protein